MNYIDLVNKTAERSGRSKAAVKEILDAIQNVTRDTLRSGDKVIIPGFVTLELTERGKRVGKDLQTGKTTEFGPTKVVVCRVSDAFKKYVRE